MSRLIPAAERGFAPPVLLPSGAFGGHPPQIRQGKFDCELKISMSYLGREVWGLGAIMSRLIPAAKSIQWGSETSMVWL
jgi:hypothetical protein